MQQKTFLAGVVIAGSLLAAYGATGTAIGVATARGSFRIDDAAVEKTATLFEGNAIDTANSSPVLQLNNGRRLYLAAGTQGKVYQDRLVLTKGTGEIAGANYAIEARSLQIRSTDAQAEARVAVSNGHVVQVAAVRGSFAVRTARGVLVARVAPGSALEFDPQEAGAAGPTTIQGRLNKVSSYYIVTDTTTNVIYQITGCEEMGSKVDKNVTVTGSVVQNGTPAGGASQVLATRCDRIVVLAGAAAGAGGGGAGAAGAGAGGVSTGVIVAGVAVAAVGAGLGGALASGAIGGGGGSTSASH